MGRAVAFVRGLERAGLPPCHAYACLHTVPLLVQVLLDAGAFVDVGSEEGTPLMCAARGGHTEAVKLLLDR